MEQNYKNLSKYRILLKLEKKSLKKCSAQAQDKHKLDFIITTSPGPFGVHQAQEENMPGPSPFCFFFTCKPTAAKEGKGGRGGAGSHIHTL